MRSILATMLLAGALLSIPNYAECKWSRVKASSHVENAEKHYKKGRYDLAVQEYENAYKVGGDFEMLFYVARSHSKARDYQKAIIYYTKYLQEGGKKVSSTKRRAVEKEIAKLKGMASFKFSSTSMDEGESEESGETGPASLTDTRAKQKAAAYVEQGNRYKAAEKFEAARKSFAKAYKIYPDYRTLYLLGMCEVRVHRLEDARSTYQKFLKEGGAAISPFTRQEVENELRRLDDAIVKQNKEEQSLTHIKDARRLYGDGAFAESLAKLEEAYRVFPNAEYLYEIGRTAIQVNDYQRALDAFRSYLAAGAGLSRPKQTEVNLEIKRLEGLVETDKRKMEAKEHFENGNKYLRSKKYPQAIEEFQTAYQVYQDSEYLYHLGNAQADYEQYSAAIATLVRYLKESKGSISKENAGKVQAKIKSLQSEEQFKKDKDKSLAHVEAGLIYSKKNNHKRALEEFVEAYRLNPDYRILLKIAEATAGTKQYKASIEAYKRYLDSGGKSISATERARIDQIIEDLTKQNDLLVAKDRSLEYYKTAKFQYENKNYEQALEDYKNAYDVYPSYRILYSIAKTKTQLEQYRGAIATYKKYLSEGGNEISAQKRKKVQEIIFGLSQKVRQADTIEKAKAHFEAGLDFKKKKKYSSAVREFNQAYNLVGDYKILYHIGQAESAQDSPTDAIDAYKRYLEEGGSAISKERRAAINKELKRLYRASQR